MRATETKSPTTIQQDTWRIMLRCFSNLRPYWRQTAGVYATLMAITGLTLLIPQFIRWIVDRGKGGQDIRLLG